MGNFIKNTGDSEGRVLAGAFSLTLSVIIVKLIGFIYKIPLSHILTDEGMGYFNSAYTIFTFFYMLCSGGVPRAVSVVVTETLVKDGERAAADVCKAAVKLFSLLGAFLTALLLAFSAPLSFVIGNRGSWLSIIAIAPSLFFVAAAGVIRGYLNGKGKLVEIAVYQVIEGAVKFVFGMLLALVAYRRGGSVQMISAFAIVGITLGSLVGCIYLYTCYKSSKRLYKTRQKSETCIKNKAVIKKIISVATPLTLGSAIMGITSIIDLLLVMQRLKASGLTESAASALYGNYTTLAIPLMNLVISLITPLSVAALPEITAQHVLGDKDALSKRAKTVLDLCAFISIPCSVAFMIFPKEILTLLFKTESAMIGAPLLSLLAPSVIFLSMLTMLNTLLEATGYTKAPLVSMGIGAAVKLIVGYLLIGNSEIGILGAPIGTTVCYGVSFVISFALALKLTSLKLTAILSLYKPLFISIISVFSSKMIYCALTNGDFSAIAFVASAAFAIGVYVILSQIFTDIDIKSALKLSKHTKKA